MAELGESISPPEVVRDEAHTEQNCPWHDEGEQPPEPPEMDAQADDDDAVEGEALAPIPANSGKKLGVNKGGKENTEIKVSYPGSTAPTPEPLQWAPHHLIPGNASLKGSKIVPYLGDNKVIAKYGNGSKIKDKQSVGYDVNCSENGVWLPSPYALSMKGKWPANQEDKLAYVEAAIDQSGGNAQFHMSHTQYSLKVASMLDKLADSLRMLTASGKCEKANDKDGDKFNAPRGLLARLHAISSRMRGLLTGPVWRPPMFTDDTQMAAYIAKKNMKKVAGLKDATSAIRIGNQ